MISKTVILIIIVILILLVIASVYYYYNYNKKPICDKEKCNKALEDSISKKIGFTVNDPPNTTICSNCEPRAFRYVSPGVYEVYVNNKWIKCEADDDNPDCLNKIKH